jgi:4-amino-4-deoxy-L-arabinose transferase-like glycosyltransferase
MNWQHKLPLLSFLGLFLVTLALIIPGIPWGIGSAEHFYYDETQYVPPAIDIIMGDFFSQPILNPPLLRFILAAEYKLYLTILEYGDGLQGYANYKHYFLCNSALFYYIARGNNILFYFGIILLMYLIGRALDLRPVYALGSAFGLAIMPVNVRYAQLATNDMLLLFLLEMALFFSILGYRRTRLKYFFLAGVAGGLATATKFNGILIFFSLSLAYLLARKKDKNALKLQGLGLIWLVSSLVFFTFCPYIFTDFRAIFHILPKPLVKGAILFWQESDYSMAYRTIREIYRQAGLPFILLALFGIRPFWQRNKQPFLIFCSLPAILFLALISIQFFYYRFVMSILIFLPISAMSALMWLQEQGSSPRRQKILIALCLALAFIPPLIKICELDYVLLQPDTRNIAKDWVEAHIPENSKIALEPFSIPLNNYRISCKDQHLGYEIFYFWDGRYYDYSFFVREKFDYVAISSAMHDEYFKHPEKYPKIMKFYTDLKTKGTLLQTFSSYMRFEDALTMKGTIELYKIEP